MKFKLDDLNIDTNEFRQRALEEAILIKSSKKDSHRDLEGNILPMVMKGHYAEWIGMTELNHTDNPEPYHDTFDHEGVDSDHKVSYSKIQLNKNISEYSWRVQSQERTGWPKSQLAHRVYGWVGDAISGDYELVGIYNYDKETKKMVYTAPETCYNRSLSFEV